MPKAPPPLVVRSHDPARQRRIVLSIALAWLGSLLLVAVLCLLLIPREAGDDGRAGLTKFGNDNEALRSRVAVLERSEQVAKAALGDLQQTLRDRDEEVAGLRADLAFYGRLVGGPARESLAVHALKLSPVANSRAWNFIATLTQNFKRGEDVSGHLSMTVEGVSGGKLATLGWGQLTQQQGSAGIGYSFKYFEQVKGTIMLPDGFGPNRVKVFADGDGGRVEQDFTWKDAAKGEETDDVRQQQ